MAANNLAQLSKSEGKIYFRAKMTVVWIGGKLHTVMGFDLPRYLYITPGELLSRQNKKLAWLAQHSRPNSSPKDCTKLFESHRGLFTMSVMSQQFYHKKSKQQNSQPPIHPSIY